MKMTLLRFAIGLQSIISLWAVYHIVFELGLDPRQFVRNGNTVSSTDMSQSIRRCRSSWRELFLSRSQRHT